MSYCLEQDTLCGPNIDIIKKSIGDEYEEILKDSLRYVFLLEFSFSSQLQFNRPSFKNV